MKIFAIASDKAEPFVQHKFSTFNDFFFRCLKYKQKNIKKHSDFVLSAPTHKNKKTPRVFPKRRKGDPGVCDNYAVSNSVKPSARKHHGASQKPKSNDATINRSTRQPTRAMDGDGDAPHVAMRPIFDAEGHICDFIFIEADDAACSYHHLKRDEFVGQRLLELFANTRQTNLFPLFRQVMETGQPLDIRGARYPHDHLDKTFVINLRAIVADGELHCYWHDATDLPLDDHREMSGDAAPPAYPLVLDRRQPGNPTEETVNQIRNLEQLAQGLIESREQQQQDLSRELHDNVAQVLAAATARISLAKDEKIPAWLRQELLDLRNQLKHALEDVRHLARDLRPAILDHLGFQATLEKHAEAFRQRTSIQLEVQVDSAGAHAFDQHHLTHLFRLTQEALQNIEDHSCASQAWVTLARYKKGLLLEIKDNGRGFSPERVVEAQADGHLGLLGMRERAELLNGNLHLQSQPKNGTTIRVSVPPPPRAQKEILNTAHENHLSPHH